MNYTHLFLWLVILIPLLIISIKVAKKQKRASSTKKSDKKVLAECGHETLLADNISAFGETIQTIIINHSNGKIPYCHRCIEKMAIQCAWCKRPIFIGDPITLYSPSNEEKFVKPDRAVIYKEKPLTLVGCGRRDCAETGADYAGFWIPPGQVKRQDSLLEQSLADIQKGGSGIVIK